MIINRQTKWTEFAPFATIERVARLREKITNCATFDFWQLTIGDFAEMTEYGIPGELRERLNSKETSVYEAVEIINACEKFLSDFKNLMEHYVITPDLKEQQASIGLPEFSPIENMLIFCQSFFHLPNFGEAEKITILEFVIAKKKSYCDIMFERNKAKIKTRTP